MPDLLPSESDDNVFPELFHCRICGKYVPPPYVPLDEELPLASELPICDSCSSDEQDSEREEDR